MTRENALSKSTNPLNREIRLDFGEKMKLMRKKKGWSKTEAAMAAGLDPSRYRRYEAGHTLMTYPVFLTILDKWDITVEEFHELLIGEKDDD